MAEKSPFTITFHNEAQAMKLRDLVDESPKNCLPNAKILDAYGLLRVLGEPEKGIDLTTVNSGPEDITVSELCRRYLDYKCDSPKPPSEDTMAGYEQYLRDHVEPTGSSPRLTPFRL